jgi:surface protein
MGIFDFLNKQTTEFKFNNKTLRIAVKNWCENEISAIKKYGHISQWDTSEVTDMARLFLNADKFNSPIGNWDVSNVTDMNGMFDNAYNFNQDISLWNVSKVNDMGEMFSAMEGKEIIFNQPIENWDVSNVTNMEYMFCNAKFFNHPIENWNVSNVVNMEGMFSRAESFNQPIGKWDVSKVINMKGIFATAKAFNQPIGNWNVSNVVNMDGMFSRAIIFNQNLSLWDVSNVNNMYGMFSSATAFNQAIVSWDVSNVRNMHGMFSNANSFNQAIGSWDVSNVSDMCGMFSGATAFNQPIGKWDVSNVSDMCGMFSGATAFNQAIGSWDVSNLTNIESMFSGASAFNQPIGSWNVSKVTNMQFAFNQASAFNQPIGNWDVNNVTNMAGMFASAKVFNQPIVNWDVSNVSSMAGMFAKAINFNQAIGSWDVSNVTDMFGMFGKTKSFNQAIGSWNVSNVITMEAMFVKTINFNQPLGSWDVSKVTNMKNMFNDAKAFNQPIGDWNVSNVFDMSEMFAGAESFNQLLENWNVNSNASNLEGMFLRTKSYDKPIPKWYIYYNILNENEGYINEVKEVKPKNNFDTQIEKIKNELSEMKEETNGELYDYSYWFDIVYNRVEAYSNSYLDNFDNENINDLSDGHCEEYRYKMMENNDIEKVEFITPRIICFAIIYEKLLLIDENDFTNEDILRLDALIFHSLTSLYGGIKFALQNIKEGQSLVNKIYPNYDLNFIEKSIKNINDKAENITLKLLPSDLRLNLNHLMKSKIKENILQKNTQEYELLIELIDRLFFIDVENTEIKNIKDIKDSTKCLIESLNKEEIYWVIRFFHGIIKYSKQYYYFELIISILELINEFEIEITNSLFDEIIDLRSSFEIIKTLKNNLKLYNYVQSINVRMKMGHFKTQQNLADILSEEFMLDNYIDNATEELGFSGEKFEKILEMTFAAKMMTFDIEYLSEILNEHEENKFYGYDYIDEIFSTYGIIYESLKKNIFS